MVKLLAVRQSMLKWNLFLSACIFVAGLLLKVGAPLESVLVGLGVAAIANWTGRRGHAGARSTTERAAMTSGAADSPRE
jgi:hypothetical protein